MTAHSRGLAILFSIFFALSAAGHAAVDAAAEKAKIESLIRNVEELKGATFIRNGSEYDAATAAKFLRKKWEAHARQISTAHDFIEKAASTSSTSGRPYVIRFKDGRQVNCGDYLSEQLKQLEAGKD